MTSLIIRKFPSGKFAIFPGKSAKHELGVNRLTNAGVAVDVAKDLVALRLLGHVAGADAAEDGGGAQLLPRTMTSVTKIKTVEWHSKEGGEAGSIYRVAHFRTRTREVDARVRQYQR